MLPQLDGLDFLSVSAPGHVFNFGLKSPIKQRMSNGVCGEVRRKISIQALIEKIGQELGSYERRHCPWHLEKFLSFAFRFRANLT